MNCLCCGLPMHTYLQETRNQPLEMVECQNTNYNDTGKNCPMWMQTNTVEDYQDECYINPIVAYWCNKAGY